MPAFFVTLCIVIQNKHKNIQNKQHFIFDIVLYAKIHKNDSKLKEGSISYETNHVYTIDFNDHGNRLRSKQ